MRGGIRVLALSVGVLVVWATGCGRKADPLPPIIEVPETTRDLLAVQEGSNATLLWSYPQLTRAGQPLRDLARIEIWKLEIPPGQETIGQGPSGEELRRQLMLTRGHLLIRLEGAGLETATRGSTLMVSDPLPALQPGTTPPVYWYAVRSRRRDGTASALSNIATLQPKLAPPQLTGLIGQPEASGIALTWEGVAGATYMLERRDPSGPGGWETLTRDAAEPRFVDRTAGQTRTWRYRVRAVAGGVYGTPSAELDVVFSDLYPPAVATGLVCLPEAGAVRLRWDSSPEPNVTYLVRRRRPGGEWQTLSTGATLTDFTDGQPLEGEGEYAVGVVDATGNESTVVTCLVRSGT